MESRQRASPQQFAAMIEFMERHGDLTKPQPGPQGRIRSDQMWQELTTVLNSLGGGVNKTSDKWKKVWIDWKTKTKKKSLVIQRDIQGTGGGPGSRMSLTDLENRVLAVMGGSTVVMGLAEVREIGFQGQPAASQPVDTEDSTEVWVGDTLQFNFPSTSQLTEERLPIPSPLAVPSPEPSHSMLLPPPSVAVSPPPADPPAPTNVAASPPRSPLVPARQGRRRPASQQGVGTTPGRTRRTLTPFERAVDVFSGIEERRLQMESERNRRQHELDLRRLEIEERRLQMDERRLEMEARTNATINNVAEVITNFSSIIAQNRLM